MTIFFISGRAAITQYFLALSLKYPRRENGVYIYSNGSSVTRYCEDKTINDKDFQVVLNSSANWQIYTDFSLSNSSNFFGTADINKQPRRKRRGIKPQEIGVESETDKGSFFGVTIPPNL